MNFSVGLAALRASQFALNTVSQNLANANTQGYHRQRVNFQSRLPQFIEGHFIGSGVDVGTIDRMRSQILESSYTRSVSDLSGAERQWSLEGQIESLFLPGDGSIHNVLGGFFDELNRLSANPSEPVQRNAVLQQGINAAQQIRDISNRLTDLKQNVRSQIEIEVDAVNQEIAELVALQKRIKVAEVQGIPNDLYDRRDQIVNQLAEKIDVQRHEQSQGGFGLTLAGSSIALGDVPIEFEAVFDEDGTVQLNIAGTERQAKFGGGSLMALAEAHNETIGQFQERVDQLASNLIRNVDQAHAQGVGTNGPFSILRSTRFVDNTQVPLNETDLAFPIDPGQLFFSVTDSAGEKRTYAVDIDPATDSLADLATRITNEAGNVQAVVDEQNGSLNIVAEPGFRFDFTGNLETVPDLTNFPNTSQPRISGQYDGDINRELDVTIIGDGTIGKTPGLLAQVTDVATGKVIAELSIGEDYEAGTELKVADGVSLSFSAGDVGNSTQFSTQLVANPDSTGALSALGLNSFFSGTDAKTIEVSQRIRDNPNELATSRSGDIADTSNLNELIQLRDVHTMDEGRLSFEDFLGETSAEVGFRVKTSRALYQNVSELNFQYESEIASVSGVDLNEEMINLANYQKSYEAAIQLMRTMETMMDELLGLVR